MKGTRVYGLEDGSHWRLEAGQYAHFTDGWHARTPNNHLANLTGHDVQEHEDGTITVSPSIRVCYGHDGPPNYTPKEVWHGFLEKGVWRHC